MPDPTVEDLPSWVANPAARALPLEQPDDEAVRATLTAFVELATVRMLSELLQADELLPFPIQSAMRLGLLQVMDLEAWLDLYVALDHAGLSDLLKLPDEAAAEVAEACGAVRASPGVLPLLRAIGELTSPPAAVVPAAVALARSPGLLEQPLCWVRSVQATSEGHAVDARVLLGTAHPAVRRTQHAEAPPVAPGLWFWDGEAAATPVPSWLARWDEPGRVLRIYGGRDGRTGHWRYPTRQRAGDVAHVVEVPHGMPEFLAEPTWRTPAPTAGFDDADTALFQRGQATTRMAEARVVVPPLAGRTEQAPPPGARLVLRVVAGPDLMRYAPLSPDKPVVVGRNHGFATFVVHHHEVSRSHTRVRLATGGEVWVQDLRSTNGSTVQGRALVPNQEAVLRPGELVGIGPVLMRLEWVTPALEERLQHIARLREDEDRRDPLTLLLRPEHLVEELPEPVRSTFRTGGEAAEGSAELWGILAYVDRLNALHAQHGARVADRAFKDVARVLQYEAEHPEHWVRVGYGELLLPMIGAGGEATRAEADRLVTAVAEHPWDAPVERLTLTAAVVRKQPSEPATEWLQRARRVLQEGRSRNGRGRVYAEV